jgi:integrase/recombinase XerD
MQEQLVNRILLGVEKVLDGNQLKKLKDILTIELSKYVIAEQRNEVVIYDETSDIAAYKQFFVSKKIQGLSDGTLNRYICRQSIYL